jgi:phage recombination protein Bet
MNAIVKHEQSSIAVAMPQLSRTELVTTLQNSLYPGASSNSVELVLDYCSAANLDPMQKPVHIVPMWNQKLGQMIDVIMPGVNSYRVQAMRSGMCAGISEPEFGPDVTETLSGVTITYPQWSRVVVKRILANGQIGEFAAKEFWKENYAVKGGKEKSIAPNGMWVKRTYGQIGKCAEAQALRRGFPEIPMPPTFEEMEGKPLLHVDAEPAPTFDYVDPAMFMAMIKDCKTDAEALALWKTHNGKLAKQPADHAAFKAAVTKHRMNLMPVAEQGPAAPVDVGGKYIPKTFSEVMTMLTSTKNLDALWVASDWIGDVVDAEERSLLADKFNEIKDQMEGK